MRASSPSRWGGKKAASTRLRCWVSKNLAVHPRGGVGRGEGRQPLFKTGLLSTLPGQQDRLWSQRFEQRGYTLSMLRVLAAFALPSYLMACAVSGSSHRAPYSCTVGEKPRLWPAIRPSNAVPGRFEIKVLDPVSPSGNQRERRVQITADAIPIGTFAARLADALGIAISVSHEVSDVRVSITAASMSVESLLDSLHRCRTCSLRLCSRALWRPPSRAAAASTRRQPWSLSCTCYWPYEPRICYSHAQRSVKSTKRVLNPALSCNVALVQGVRPREALCVDSSFLILPLPAQHRLPWHALRG